ncbi:MAG: CopD family protein [Leptospiraceae bacterium]|nr:CopD family protein [Leptospiraceae bacterium]
MYAWILSLHVLAATVWTGGHLILSLTILPGVLKNKDIEFIRRFESSYETIGIPALIIQIFSGLWMAGISLGGRDWFDFSNPVSRLVSYKLLLLFLTFVLAIDARLRIIPRLNKENLISLAFHIVPVTILSVLYVFLGVLYRYGYL